MKLLFVFALAAQLWSAELTLFGLANVFDSRYVPLGSPIRIRAIVAKSPLAFTPQLSPVCPGNISVSVNGRQISQRAAPAVINFEFSFVPESPGWQEIQLEYRDPSGQCAPSRLRDYAHAGTLGPPYYRIWPANGVVRAGDFSAIMGVFPPNTPALFQQTEYYTWLSGTADPSFVQVPDLPFYRRDIAHVFVNDTDAEVRLSLLYGPVGSPMLTLASTQMRFLRDGIIRLETVTGQSQVSSSLGMELMASFDSAPLEFPTAEITWYDGTTILARRPASRLAQQFRLPALSPGRHLLRAEINGTSRSFKAESNVLVLDVNPTSLVRLSASSASSTSNFTQTDRITLSARVESDNNPLSSGEVEFLLRSRGGLAASVGKTPLREGIARLEISNLATGDYIVSARYSGSGSIAGAEAEASFSVEAGLSIRNSASGAETLAPDSLASIYGRGLGLGTQISGDAPLTLGGVRVEWEDSSGRRTPSRLLFVSPTQINLLVPNSLSTGRLAIILSLEGRNPIRIAANLSAVSPGIFTVDSQKIPSGLVTLRRRNGTLVQQFTFQCLLGEPCRPQPIAITEDIEEAVLTLYGTGLRAQGSTAVALIGDLLGDVLYAGQQPEFLGLDQVNIRLPLSLRGRGTVPLLLRTRDAQAQALELNFR